MSRDVASPSGRPISLAALAASPVSSCEVRVLTVYGRVKLCADVTAFDTHQQGLNAWHRAGARRVPITPRGPALNAPGSGLQLKLQNRLVEYEAITSMPDRLPTGAKVRVVGMAGNVLEVEPVKAAAAV